MDILGVLKEIEDFKNVPEDQLQWLIDQGEILQLRSDDHLFKPGDPIDKLLIILEGSVVMKIKQGNQFRLSGSLEKHSISGLLPYSRANKAQAYAVTNTETVVLRLNKEHFREMIIDKEELTTALVHKMSSRIRQFTRFEQQNDKILALGKLSAGLAHELNNPSAAIMRSAEALGKRIRSFPQNLRSVATKDVSAIQLNAVNELLNTGIRGQSAALNMMERSEREDELIDWLEDHDLEDPTELAENLVDCNITLEQLDELAAVCADTELSDLLNWVDQVLASEKLVQEIEDASSRINKLISAVKGYTHMDQAPEKQPEDIHKGLESTLTMLNHKIKKTGIQVKKEYGKDLKHPCIMVSEMNQVWTNLIDNAIDAMENTDLKELTLRTSQDGHFINVYICDTGTGIPEDVQEKIYDPFFTTKPVGKGTGLGMEVVQYIVSEQHSGSVSFQTRPGYTEFKVCIPIDNPE